MNIEKYVDYFHDGALIDIQHIGDKITLSLENAEMDLANLKDSIQLSEHSTIKGKLHLNGIKSIQIRKTPFSGHLKMPYDSGCIFDFLSA